MAGTLFDQMMKAGLVDKQKAKKVKKEKYQQGKNNKQKKGTETISESAKLAEIAKKEKADKAQKLNLQRKAEQEKKSLQAEIRQIIESNRLKDFAGNENYSFVDGAVVKSLNLKPAIRKSIIAGNIRIARYKGGFALLEADVADKIIQRDSTVLIALSTDKESSDKMSQEDKDYYAKFEIPDDLVW